MLVLFVDLPVCKQMFMYKRKLIANLVQALFKGIEMGRIRLKGSVSIQREIITSFMALRRSSHSFHSYVFTILESMKCVSVCVPQSAFLTGASIRPPGIFP